MARTRSTKVSSERTDVVCLAWSSHIQAWLAWFSSGRETNGSVRTLETLNSSIFRRVPATRFHNKTRPGCSLTLSFSSTDCFLSTGTGSTTERYSSWRAYSCSSGERRQPPRSYSRRIGNGSSGRRTSSISGGAVSASCGCRGSCYCGDSRRAVSGSCSSGILCSGASDSGASGSDVARSGDVHSVRASSVGARASFRASSRTQSARSRSDAFGSVGSALSEVGSADVSSEGADGVGAGAAASSCRSARPDGGEDSAAVQDGASAAGSDGGASSDYASSVCASSVSSDASASASCSAHESCGSSSE